MQFVTEGHSSGGRDYRRLLQNLLFGMVTELTIYFKYLITRQEHQTLTV
jgi:hypothetical protein